MNVHPLQFVWLRALVISMLLILPVGIRESAAQIAAPLPSRAQVVAQGVQSFERGQVKWQIESRTANKADKGDPTQVSRGFIYASDEQLLISQDSGALELLSPGQATLALASNPKLVGLVSEDSTEFFTIALLDQSAPDSGAVSEQFEIQKGAYNLQLTRGVINPGDRDKFSPVNDMIYLVVVMDGSIELGPVGELDKELMEAGDVMTWTGNIEIKPRADAPASYLIASIGDAVEIAAPTLVAEAGEISLTFYDCPESALASGDAAACTLITYPVQASLTMKSGNRTVTKTTGMDAVEKADNSWLFTDMQTGTWEFSLTIGDASVPPTIGMSGDFEQRDGTWHIPVTENNRSTVNVFLADIVSGPTGASLRVVFYECPSGTDPNQDLSGCVPATTEPNLSLTHLGGTDMLFSTFVDAGSDGLGVYVFYDLPEGTYVVSLDYNQIWNFDAVHFGGDAYSDGLDVFVDVYKTGAQQNTLYVALSPIGDASNIDVTQETANTGTAQVIVVQMECTDASQSSCVYAEVPWEVYLINDATGETYVLTNEGTLITDGQWLMFVPAGVYSVQLPSPAGWTIDYSGRIEVLGESETYVYITGYP